MGFDFLFLGALIGLPLAALPVALHLLFRRRSPVVLFSTTRFIRASMQRTAARRRVQKWLLLAARVLMVLLLVFIAAQPAKRLAASLTGGEGGSSVAAIVVDTSYSMQLSHEQQTLLERADQIVVSLLQNELSGGSVAIFESLPSTQAELLRSANERLAQWTPLKPQPSPQPLADRIQAAMRLLDAQQAQNKWLIVLTDGQSREFPRALNAWDGGQFVVFDLKPPVARSAGVTGVALDPDQPLPGVGVEAAIRVAGRSGDARAISANVVSLGDGPLATASPRIVQIESAGQSEVRLPIKLPAERYLVVRARIDGEDDLAWDDVRQVVIETPRQRKVKLLTADRATPAERFVTLALDPGEGRSADWPLRVTSGKNVAPDDSAVVALLNAWPTVERAGELRAAVERGATLVLLLRPGLQEAWGELPASQRDAIRPLLPGDPVVDPSADRPHRASPPAIAGSLLKELLDERFQLGAMTAARLVPFNRSPDAAILVAAAPTGDGASTGLVYRHTIGGPGSIYTFATLPEPQFSTLATHPVFLPLIVRCCLPEAGASSAQNVELGQTLRLALPGESKLTLTTPAGEPFVVERAAGAGEFVFARADQPGLYRWTNAGGNIVGVSNVQLPADEAVLKYRDVPDVMPGETVIVAKSLDDFRTHLEGATQPSPRWSPLIACVLLLLCL